MRFYYSQSDVCELFSLVSEHARKSFCVVYFVWNLQQQQQQLEIKSKMPRNAFLVNRICAAANICSIFRLILDLDAFVIFRWNERIKYISIRTNEWNGHTNKSKKKINSILLKSRRCSFHLFSTIVAKQNATTLAHEKKKMNIKKSNQIHVQYGRCYCYCCCCCCGGAFFLLWLRIWIIVIYIYVSALLVCRVLVD